MKKIYTYILLFTLLGIGYGCEKSSLSYVPEQQKTGNKIILGTNSETNVSGTRASTNFPNGGSIGVMAATALASPITGTDWAQYSDINNAEAVASRININLDPPYKPEYYFDWKSQKYWPFDGADLYFMAYSPITTGNSHYMLSTMNNSLYIQLQKTMPDIMYASNNVNPQPYNKIDSVVDLGEFRHALSQLTVKVIAGDGLPSTIKVNKLSVSTTATVANLFLPLGDDGLIVTYGAEYFTNELVGGTTDFQNGVIQQSLYLFPKTQDVTMISITLVDTSNTNNTFEGNYMMSYFESDNLGEEIKLERAKNTLLEITVKITNVENPNTEIDLKGKITPWIDGGDFSIGIN